MNERLILLREKLGLTTRKFGECLNVTGGTITNMEKGNRNITNRTIACICKEFNVNEEWLRHGTGEMFIESSLSIDDYIRQNGATDFELNLIKAWFKIPAESRNSIINQLKDEFNKI
ncbi:helix-turn-helix transcriptional regulator [uncultured Clostridium sp.]|uniref:helix-turn-helix domain-containing protein n=1 Tax=uncultured Clostridium sp. TaxID=59620 RepID=UPI00280C2699|nr:helix-turn-helix transcriptional regulator [uncultured Clostridium sp.]